VPKKIGIGWTNFAAVAMETKKGDLKKIGFLSSNFMKLCRNNHRSVSILKNQLYMAYDIPTTFTRFHKV
jgi:hypothetical protein